MMVDYRPELDLTEESLIEVVGRLAAVLVVIKPELPDKDVSRYFLHVGLSSKATIVNSDKSYKY